MAQQTAVKWLIEQLSEKQPNGFYVIDTLEDVKRVFKQAKQMEKEQIMNAFSVGDDCGYRFAITEDSQQFNSAEQYYNETYNKS